MMLSFGLDVFVVLIEPLMLFFHRGLQSYHFDTWQLYLCEDKSYTYS